MSVIAKAIADRQSEIERLQVEIKPLKRWSHWATNYKTVRDDPPAIASIRNEGLSGSR